MPDRSLAASEERIQLNEIEQKRRERISIGMRQSVAHGRPIGRPKGKQSNAAVVAKYPAVVSALQGGSGVRAAARETGVAVNTIQKVRAALNALKTPSTIALVIAAQSGDQIAFNTLAEAYRRELLVHCYRMLGSLHDAEDLVQETLLRAWEKRATLLNPESYRAWLYRIATNLCLNMLTRTPRRFLPSEIYPQSDVNSPLSPPIQEPIWLEPIPDEYYLDGQYHSPEDHVIQQEHLTLAFLVALQHLTPVQRSVLLLREVLDLPAAEVSDWINLSVPAVNSALQRARRVLRQHYEVKDEKPRSQIQALLERFRALWERADIPELVALMREDTWFTMPPIPTWFQGRNTIAMVFALRIFILGRDMRVLPTHANGSPAFVSYWRDTATDDYRFGGLFVLEIVGDQVGRLDAFMEPSILAAFALPVRLPA